MTIRLFDEKNSALSIFLLILLILFSAPRFAEAGDNIFTSATVLKEGVKRLGDEGLEVLKAPIGIQNYGLITTLAVAGGVGVTYLFDNDIRGKVAGTKGRTLDTATDVGEVIGNPFVHLGVAGLVYCGGILADSPKWRETGEMLGEAAILADAASFILKESIGRSRPFVSGDKGNFKPFGFRSDYDSMPSMHAASSFALASVMASTSESLLTKALYYSAAAFVGFSRIYQDKHWASDVLLGAAIGELCGRIVTSYHASHRKIALAPMVTGNSASVALVGSW
jgi:membrane-associated phospholipid phosphatase